MCPLKLTQTEPHVVKGDQRLRLIMLFGDGWHPTVSRREMSQNRSPDIALSCYFEDLEWRSMTPLNRYLFHSILKSCLVNEHSRTASVVREVLAHSSIAGVEQVTVRFADEKAAV